MSGHRGKDRTKAKAEHPSSTKEQRPDPQSRKKEKLLLFLIIAVTCLVFLVHLPSLSAQAFSYDDEQYLVSNQLVKSPSLTSAGRFLTEVLRPSTVRGYYQPLTMISLMLDYAMGGRAEKLTVFHITSLILHLLNTVLIIILLYLLFNRVWFAALAGLVFGIHPITVDIVAWVSERKTPLATCFALVALVLYVLSVRKKRKGYLWLSLAAYVLALLAKPTVVPLPLLMLVLDYWLLNRLNKAAVLEKVPFYAVAMISAVVTYISQMHTAFVLLPQEYPPLIVPLIFLYNSVLYLFRMLLPFGTMPVYPFPEPFDLTNPAVLGSVAAAMAVLAVVAIAWRKRKWLFCGWLFFFLAILPTLGFIGFTNYVAAGKYAYLPSLGLLLMAGVLTGQATPGTSRAFRAATWRLLCVAVMVIIISGETIGTVCYARNWKSTESLFTYMLHKYPQSSILQNDLGVVQLSVGRVDEAIASFRRSIQMGARDEKVYSHMGSALTRKGEYDEAIRNFNRAIQADPHNVDAINGIGFALALQGNYDAAIVRFRQAIDLNPNYPKPYFNLGAVCFNMGLVNESIANFETYCRYIPDDFKAYNYLGMLYAETGQNEQAEKSFRTGLSLSGDSEEVYFNLGVFYIRQNNVAQAVDGFRNVIRINPDNAQGHLYLGMVLEEQGDPAEAAKEYREALRIDPRMKEAQSSLDRLMAK